MNPWAKKIAISTLGATLSLEPVVNAAAAEADQTEPTAGGLPADRLLQVAAQPEARAAASATERPAAGPGYSRVLDPGDYHVAAQRTPGPLADAQAGRPVRAEQQSHAVVHDGIVRAVGPPGK
jgi:hypothetical protein